MLSIMRQGANSPVIKIFVFGLLMMGAIGLAMTGGYGAFRDISAHGDTVATIGHTKFDASTFDQTVRRTLSQKGLDAKTAYELGYIDQLLNIQISSNLLTMNARDLGLAVGDEMVAKQIKNLVAPLARDGASIKDTMRSILRSQGMSESQFVEEMRGEMSKTLLNDALQSGTSVMSNQEATDYYLYQNEKRSAETLYLPDSSIRDYKTPTDAVLKPFYQAGQERYAIPESRAFTLAVLSDKAVKDAVAVSDDDLKKIYEEQKQSFALPERRTLEQAVMQDQKQGQAVATAVSKGKSLKDAVKEATGDTKDYTGLQTYQSEGLDKALSEPVFKAGKGATVGPVQTPLGWHVLIVKDIKPSEQQPFEAVKDKLKTEQIASRSGEALYTASTQMDDALAGGASLDDVAKKFNLDVMKMGPVHKDGSTPDKKDGLKDFVKDSATILNTAFGMGGGETSPVIALSDGRYAAIRMETITPKSYMPFDQVKDQLSKQWIADQQDVLNKDRVKDALAQLKSGKTTLAALAKADGGEVKKVDLTRAAPAPQPLTDQIKAALFEAAKDNYIVQPAQGGLIIGRVTGISLPDGSKAPADQLKTIREASLQNMQDEILQAYLDFLRVKYNVTVNKDLLKSMYDKAANNGAEDNDPSADQ